MTKTKKDNGPDLKTLTTEDDRKKSEHMKLLNIRESDYKVDNKNSEVGTKRGSDVMNSERFSKTRESLQANL